MSTIGVLLLVATTTAAVIELPYTTNCPVILDNDWVWDSYDLPYTLALASAGRIKLKGIVVTHSWTNVPSEYNVNGAQIGLQLFLSEYQSWVDKARSCGMTNLPDPVPGPWLQLTKPATGQIEDTIPIDSVGTQLIRQQARLASSTNPLVVICGGPITAPVSAYLQDPFIREKMVLAWLHGRTQDNFDFNAVSDPWAAYIALDRLRVVGVALNGEEMASSHIPLSRLMAEYYENALKPDLLKIAMGTGPAGPYLGARTNQWDGLGLVLMVRPDFATAWKHVKFGSFFATQYPGELSTYKDVGCSDYLLVFQGDSAVATAAWWQALLDPAVYHGQVQVPPPPPPPPITNGLVAYWRLDEQSGVSASDYLEVHPGTLNNFGITPWTAGRVGNALNLDGRNDYVRIPYAADFNVGAQMSVALWVMKTGNATNWFEIIIGRQVGNTANDVFDLYYDNSPNDRYGAVVRTPVALGRVVAGNGVADIGFWTHLAMTYDGATLRLYRNGFELGNAPLTGNVVADTTGILLGAGDNPPFGTTEFTQAKLDDVRLYNRALTAAEVLMLANP